MAPVTLAPKSRASSPAPVVKKTRPVEVEDKENIPSQNVDEEPKKVTETGGGGDGAGGRGFSARRRQARAAVLAVALVAGVAASLLATREPSPALTAASGLAPLRPQEAPGVDAWLTAGARSLAKSNGMLYHEVALHEPFGDEGPQFGWLTEQFLKGDYDGHGVGDDEHGWAADGVRHQQWHKGATAAAWPRSWRGGDVIGFAVDLDAGRMYFSLNGEWVDSAEMSFEWVGSAEMSFKTPGWSLFPAVSTSGAYTMHVSKATWQFAPPSGDYEAWANSGVFTRPIAQMDLADRE